MAMNFLNDTHESRPYPPLRFIEDHQLTPYIGLVPANEVQEWMQRQIIDDAGSLFNPDHGHLADADLRFMWASSAFEKKGRHVLGQAEEVAMRAGGWQKARMEQQMHEWFGDVPKFIINMFSTFIILSIINPYQVEDEPELKLNKLHEDQSFFEMLGEYILAGFKIAMIIAAMLIGFIALISAVNALFSAVLGISFQQILGYVFYPLAWLIGIPAEEALKAGSIMATKLVANEFVAMIELKKIAAELSPRGLGILSVFLVSFANFASIGIVAGAIKGLNEQQGNVVSRFGLKLVYGSTLVSLLSAAIAGLVL